MIALEQSLRDRLARAIDDQIPVSAAYVDVDGKPRISFYGSTHAFSGDQLAVWVRNPEGALPEALLSRPGMAISYGSIADRVYCIFEGRGRVVADASTREQVYQGMHAIERMFDPECKGLAVLVDLDRVTLLSAATGKQVLERADL